MVVSGLRTKKLLRLRNDKNEVYYSGILRMIPLCLWSKSYLINVNKENGFDLCIIPNIIHSHWITTVTRYMLNSYSHFLP